MRITEMDKNLREALRVTKNFIFNYFYYNKTYINFYVSETNSFIRGTVTREKTKGTRRSRKMKERNK